MIKGNKRKFLLVGIHLTAFPFAFDRHMEIFSETEIQATVFFKYYQLENLLKQSGRLAAGETIGAPREIAWDFTSGSGFIQVLHVGWQLKCPKIELSIGTPISTQTLAP